MTVREAIERVDDVKPNSFTEQDKVRALNQLEQKIMAEVFYWPPVEINRQQLIYPDCLDYELLVDPPYDDIYEYYLEAWVDEHNGEYERYANSSALFNNRYGNFLAWFKNLYSPIEGYHGEERRFRHGYV